jgi:hypothetical protein
MVLLNTSIFTPSTLSVYAVNTAVPSTLLTLPPVSTQQGSIYIIKDMAGNAFTNRIVLSTTGVDGLSTTTLSTNYGTWFLMNDGIKSWFFLDSYGNSISTGTRKALAPFASISVTVSLNGSTLFAYWTAAVNAVSYSVSYYSNTVSLNTGGTLIQTVTGLTGLSNFILQTPSPTNYYYAIVTAINANGNTVTSSSAIYPSTIPSTPSGLTLTVGTSNLQLQWTGVSYAITYVISFYQGSSLFQSQTILASSGTYLFTTLNATKSSAGGYDYYAYTSGTGNFNITSGSATVDLLLVAGGGAGGSQHGGGGGGAGEVLYLSNVTLAASNYSVSVGIGGASNPSVSPYNGGNGSNSIFGNYISIGGGGGGGETGIPPTGGFNGGGAAGGPNTINGAAAGSDSYGNTGFKGGNNGQTTSYGSGGGGGGATAAGADATGTGIDATTSGNGGSGTSAFSSWGLATTTGQNITGTVWYGGGGGGGYWGGIRGGGSGGNGGGATGGNNSGIGGNGTPNTGGGGGGSPGNGPLRYGGTGGSGVIILRLIPSLGNSFTLSTTNTLVAGASYYATVQAVNVNGASPTAISQTVASGIVPLATDSVIIYLNGYTLLCIWNTATNATSYRVLFYQNATATTTGGALFETVTSLGTVVQQASSTPLVNGNYYYATVTSVNIYGSSAAVTSSGTSVIVALPPSAPPYV